MVLSNTHSILENKFYENLVKHIQKVNEDRAEYFEKQKNEKTAAIFEIIRLYSFRNGITINELSQLVNMNRKSLRPYIQKLEKNQLIKRSKNGLMPTQSSNKDLAFETEIFSESIAHVLRDDKPIILNEKSKMTLFTSDTLRPDLPSDTGQTYPAMEVDFTGYKNLYASKFTEKDVIEESLFEFSNRIGAFITYLMIYYMDPRNSLKELSSTGNDEYLRRSIEACISGFSHFLLDTFASYLRSIMVREKPFYEESKILLNENVHNELLKAFLRIYPLMSYEFEKILNKRPFFEELLQGWSSTVDDHRILLDAFQGRLKNQESCSHEFDKSFEPASKNVNIKKCVKCGKIVTIKRINSRTKQKKTIKTKKVRK